MKGLTMDTIAINEPNHTFGELVETSDPALFGDIGKDIRLATIGREYRNAPISWSRTNDERVMAEYKGLHAVFWEVF